MTGTIYIVDPPTAGTTSVIAVSSVSVPFVSPEWVIAGVAGNPRINVVVGRTYVFSVSTPNLLFALHTVGGDASPSARVTDGSVSGQGTASVIWTVSAGAPATVYYQSEVNAGQFGEIVVLASAPADTTPPAAATTTAAVAATTTGATTTGAPSTAAATTATATTTAVTAASTTTPAASGASFTASFLDVPFLPNEWAINNVASNPLIRVVRGRNYTFSVLQPSKLVPIFSLFSLSVLLLTLVFAQFAIHSSPGGGSSVGRYDVGVSGQATALLTWEVAADAPNVLYYVSELAAGAQGQIAVVSSYTARFYSDSAACATAPSSVVTQPAGTCFPNPFNPQFGYIKAKRELREAPPFL